MKNIHTQTPVNLASGQGGHYKVYGGPSKGPCIMHYFDDSIGHEHPQFRGGRIWSPKKNDSNQYSYLAKKATGVHVRHIFHKFCKKNVWRILFQIHFTPTCRLSAQQGKNHWQQQFQGVTPVESIIGKICIDPHSLPKIRKDANKKVTRFSWGKKVTDIQ